MKGKPKKGITLRYEKPLDTSNRFICLSSIEAKREIAHFNLLPLLFKEGNQRKQFNMI